MENKQKLYKGQTTDNSMQEKRVTIHICTKDRFSELLLTLQSLRTQSYQNWDLIIYDDGGNMNIFNQNQFQSIINRLKLENHKIKLLRNEFNFGLGKARNHVVNNDDFENYYTMRLDDDVILDTLYIEKLLEVINNGYDIASGTMPSLWGVNIKRETKALNGIINKIHYKDDIIIDIPDDCGLDYLDEKILPAHHARGCSLYKSKINKDVSNPENLTPTAFREDTTFSLKAIIKGYKIGVHTGARAMHFAAPIGGCRTNNYGENVTLDNKTFMKWFKNKINKHGDFLKEQNEEVKE